MITRLSIANFKSIRQLDIDCKKVNIFIGEPNTGKSNILEALALLSWCGESGLEPLSDYIRFQVIQNLFFDQLLDHEIKIGTSTSDEASRPGYDVTLKNNLSDFRFQINGMRFRGMDYQGNLDDPEVSVSAPIMENIKFFRFKNLVKYDDADPHGLRPPNGRNLFTVVFTSKNLRETVAEFFRKYGLKLVLKPQERLFELQRQADDLVFSFPYSLSSDTLRRIIFYTVAMASNKDSVLVFEEPESNAFPYYTRYLGEQIARDETNQFFIATHNPYLLSAVVEKSRAEDIQVFITYFKDYETRVRSLNPDELAELMEADPFLNLDLFLEEPC
jgi:hypothetical protein